MRVTTLYGLFSLEQVCYTSGKQAGPSCNRVHAQAVHASVLGADRSIHIYGRNVDKRICLSQQ